jgi:hypothetical protein
VAAEILPNAVALLKLESPLDWMPVTSQKRGWSRAYQ